MSYVCKNCNTEFDGGIFCPQCGTKAQQEAPKPVETPAQPQEIYSNSVQKPVQPIPQPVQPAQPVQPTQPVKLTQPVQLTQPAQPAQPVQPTAAPVQPQQATYQQPAASAQPATPAAPAQPSKVGLAIKQGFEVVKGFFSKNVADVTSAQYKEQLPVWIVLLALPLIIAAISGYVCHTSHGESLMMFESNKYIYWAEDWLHMIAQILYAVALVLSVALTVFGYGKLVKKQEVSFSGSLNMTSTALMPMAFASVAIILFVKVFEEASYGSVVVLAIAMSLALLYKGVQAIYGDMNLWKFYLLALVAVAIFIAVSYLISMPIDSIAEDQMKDALKEMMGGYGDYGDLDQYSDLLSQYNY